MVTDTSKLTVELVPAPSWYNNLRRCISEKDWNKIREKTFNEYKYACSICGAKGKLNCHEEWEYNDKNYVQKLIGFVALCNMCHSVKHIGLTKILAVQGKLDFKKVVKHFMKINNCSRRTFEKHVKIVFEEWHRRSQYQWKVDLGEYEEISTIRKRNR